MLLKSVYTVFSNAVETSVATLVPYLSLNQPLFDPEAIPARKRYLARRRKLLNNILRWRKYTGERFGIGLLVTQLLNDCMLPVAESGWEVGGEECMKKVRNHTTGVCVHSKCVTGCNHTPQRTHPGRPSSALECTLNRSRYFLPLV